MGKSQSERLMNNDEIYLTAVANGCKPLWADGIVGWAWHCTCEDGTHYYDQQCSVITTKTAGNR